MSDKENFHLPQGILRNLTPSRKYEQTLAASNGILDLDPNAQSSSRHCAGVERKKRYIQAKQAQLRLHSEKIQKRSKLIKQQQQELINNKIRRSKDNFERAALRRGKYLGSIKARAGRFCSKRSPGPESQLELKNNVDDGARTKHSKTHSATRMTKYQSFFLKHSIPDNHSNYRYSPIIYGFDLILDCDKALLTGDSPGFNVNLSTEPLINFKQNFLWVLLYKYAHELVRDVKRFISDANFKDQFLRTMNVYLFIFDIFKKTHYDSLLQMLSEATQILDTQIAYLPENSDLIRQRQNLIEQGKALRKHNTVSELDEASLKFIQKISDLTSSYKGQFNRSQRHHRRYMYFDGFKAVYNMFEHQCPPLLAVPPMVWRTYWFLKHLDMFMDTELPKLMGQRMTTVPSSWSSLRNKAGRCPKPSQKRELANYSSSLDIDEILDSLGVRLSDKYADLDDVAYDTLGGDVDPHKFRDALKLFTIVRRVYYDVLHWARNTPASTQSERFDVSSLAESLDLGVETDYAHVTPDELNLKLISDLQCMVSIFELASRAKLVHIARSCLQIAQNQIFCSHSRSIDFIDQFSTLEHCFNNACIQECLSMICGGSFNGIVRSENAYTMLSADRIDKIRFSFYTHSPCVLFPVFHAKLRKWEEWHAPLLENMSAMIEGSLFKPQILCEEDLDEETGDFFGRFFKWLVLTTGDSEPDELNHIYKNTLMSCREDLMSKIHSCALATLYCAYGGRSVNTLKADHAAYFARSCRDISAKNTQEFAQSLDHDFGKFYLTHRERIEDVLARKLDQMWQAVERKEEQVYRSLLQGSFRHFEQEVDVALKQSVCSVRYIYRMYHPMLNWIYKDSGIRSNR